LYLWSAPMDVAEDYQQFLDLGETSTSSNQSFYNCTLPNFGAKCEYVLYDGKPHQTSLHSVVQEFYHYNQYKPTTLTCYAHLQCHRGPSPLCLDWTEICDGKVDCTDGGHDEKHCW
jgi:hypothetical protein